MLASTERSLVGDVLTITRTYTERDPTKAELLAYAANKRATRAASGTFLGNTFIPTDLDTRTMLLGFYIKSLQDAAFTVKWKLQDGTVMTLNATNIQNASRQVGVFLGDCL